MVVSAETSPGRFRLFGTSAKGELSLEVGIRGFRKRPNRLKTVPDLRGEEGRSEDEGWAPLCSSAGDGDAFSDEQNSAGHPRSWV